MYCLGIHKYMCKYMCYCSGIHMQYMCIVYAVTCVLFRQQAVHVYCLGIHKQYMCIVYVVTSSTCVLFRYSQAVHVYCLGIHKQYMCIVYVVTSSTCVLFTQ